MSWFSKLSEDKYKTYIRWVSLLSQLTILLLAIVLVINITTRQYHSAQVDSIRVELIEMIESEKRLHNESLRMLKDELVSYQATREGRAKLFADKLEQYKNERLVQIERLDRRLNNLNSKVNYWTKKIKDEELQKKLKEFEDN